MNRKPAARTAAATRDRVAKFARVQRPGLLDFLLDAFWRLPKLPQAIIDSPVIRTDEYADAGWTIPEDSLGRKGVDALTTPAKYRSQAESIRLWIRLNLEGIIDPEKVAVVVEDDGATPVIRVYRKA